MNFQIKAIAILLSSVIFIKNVHYYSNYNGKTEQNEIKSEQSENKFVTICHNYHPNYDSIPSLPLLNDTLRKSVRELIITNKTLAFENILLVILKLYKAQLYCCNQSYDLCGTYSIKDSVNNPFVYYFEKLSNTSIHCHEASSSLAYDWVISNEGKMQSPQIHVEVDSIRLRLKWIDSLSRNIDIETK